MKGLNNLMLIAKITSCFVPEFIEEISSNVAFKDEAGAPVIFNGV